jgi:hypothetical protein
MRQKTLIFSGCLILFLALLLGQQPLGSARADAGGWPTETSSPSPTAQITNTQSSAVEIPPTQTPYPPPTSSPGGAEPGPTETGAATSSAPATTESSQAGSSRSLTLLCGGLAVILVALVLVIIVRAITHRRQ